MEVRRIDRAQLSGYGGDPGEVPRTDRAQLSGPSAGGPSSEREKCNIQEIDCIDLVQTT